jgi:hypothetical protein
MLAHLDALPDPQQAALRTAFGLSSDDAPDRFLVALAALSLLAEVAEEQPLLCLVDDAQWLDTASRQALGFVARRLLAEPVAVVFAVREPVDERELVGLPEMSLKGLADDDARALLEAVVPGRLDERVRDRIVAETRGNPLALLELSRSVGPAQLAGGFALPDAGDVVDREAGAGAGVDRAVARDRRAGPISASAGQIRGLPCRLSLRQASGSRRARVGHRSRDRS